MTLTVFLLSFGGLILLGCPIALTLIGASWVAMLTQDIPYVILPRTMVEGVRGFTLVAIPLYIVAGEIMNVSGVTERIFNSLKSIVGHRSAGLAHVNVLASMIFAGISGSASADAAGLGRVEIKAMKDSGYDIDFSGGITAASSIIGPIIPPSIHLVIYGVAAEVSIGALFFGGLVPGVLAGISLMMIVFLRTKFGTLHCPTSEKFTWGERWEAFKRAFLSLLAPIIILGGILSGVVTASEAGVIAVVYSLILGLIYKKLNFKVLFGVFKRSISTIGVVMFIIAGAKAFSWFLLTSRIGFLFKDFMLGFITNKTLILLFMILTFLALGTIETAVANILILTPIFLPLTLGIGLDPVHFGVIMIFALMIGLITPPVGTSLYITAEVAQISVERITREVATYYIPLLIVLFLTIFIPGIVLFLPKILRLG